MKSRITLNDKKRTHFKIYPTKNTELKEIEAESFYNRLNSDESKRHYIQSNKHKGYKIGVWTLDDYAVLSMCLVNEFKTQNCSIWIVPIDDLDDLKACAKFLHENYSTIISGFKEEVTENKKLLENIQKQRLIEDISA